MGSILGWEDFPGGGHGHPLQCSCLENPCGQRSLAGYSPWGRRESDTTERSQDTCTSFDDKQKVHWSGPKPTPNTPRTFHAQRL